MSLNMRPICIMCFYNTKDREDYSDGVSVTKVVDCI